MKLSAKFLVSSVKVIDRVRFLSFFLSFTRTAQRNGSSCLVYCSTPTGLNLANFEIFTGGLSHTVETISIFDTSV